MRTCTSTAPASRSIRISARWVLPRTIESSTTISRLPRITSFSGLSLSRIPSWRMVCDGWMKVRPDVGVLHQALPEGDAGLLRVADRGRGAGFRDADHQVGVDGPFAGEPAADVDAGLVHRAARRSCCPAGPGRRTRTRSPSGWGWRSGWTAPRRRRWPAAHRARYRGRRTRRRCPARRSPRPPPSRGRAGPATAAARRTGRGPRTGCSRP